MPGNEHPALGLQLWVNLASKYKMVEPRYQELLQKDIPTVTKDGVTARVIAGEALGTSCKIQTYTPVHYIYFTMQPNSELRHRVPAGWTTFIYTVSGKVNTAPSAAAAPALVEKHHTVVFDPAQGDGVLLRTGAEPAEFALIAGQPLGEPIASHGPMVMNTQAEIRQAFYDYQHGTNGFERARNWHSKIASGRD